MCGDTYTHLAYIHYTHICIYSSDFKQIHKTNLTTFFVCFSPPQNVWTFAEFRVYFLLIEKFTDYHEKHWSLTFSGRESSEQEDTHLARTDHTDASSLGKKQLLGTKAQISGLHKTPEF